MPVSFVCHVLMLRNLSKEILPKIEQHSYGKTKLTGAEMYANLIFARIGGKIEN